MSKLREQFEKECGWYPSEVDDRMDWRYIDEYREWLEQRLKANHHETFVIGKGELEHPISFLEAELDSLKDAYRESTNSDYSRMVVSVKKAIKILKERQ